MSRRVSDEREGIDSQRDAKGPKRTSRATGATQPAHDQHERDESHRRRLGKRRLQNQTLQRRVQRAGDLAAHARGLQQIVKGDEAEADER